MEKKPAKNSSSDASRAIGQKLMQKTKAKLKTQESRVFDEHGIHIKSGQDQCDCLMPNCLGCFFPCPDCASLKCGPKCRINRTYAYQQVHVKFEGFRLKFNNPYVQWKK